MEVAVRVRAVKIGGDISATLRAPDARETDKRCCGTGEGNESG